MKANEAPEKIWVKQNAFKNTWPLYIDENSNYGGVEYTRSDAFIEKALSWLKNHYRDYMYNPTGKSLEAFFGGDMCNDFEDYIKKEY